MSGQSPPRSDMTNNCSAAGDNNLSGLRPVETFKWTTRLEECLLRNMIGLKPAGINKHLSMLLLKERLSKELKLNIPIRVLWDYVSTKWDIRAADNIEGVSFDISEKDFVLPEEFDQLIAEELEKIKKLEKESLNDEIYKKKLLKLSDKTSSKSNSMSSVDLKEDLNETVPSIFNISNQSENVEKIEKTSKFRGRKGKSRNVSESSFSSDNNKQRKGCKNNLTDFSISDSSSNSVIPEILIGKTSNDSVTPETISIKSNMHCSDEIQITNQKFEQFVTEFNLKDGHCVDLGGPPEIRIKHEKHFASLRGAKSKHLIQSENETNNKA